MWNYGRCGLSIDVYHRIQPNKSKLALYMVLISFKTIYISNKTDHFSYKGGCVVDGHTHISAFKRRAGLGYKLMTSDY